MKNAKPLLISHRGNLAGPNRERENHPDYIDEAINAGFEVEVDMWLIDEKHWWLGHDAPQYKVDPDWLLHKCTTLWIHCKNCYALEGLARYDIGHRDYFRYFFHQDDQYTLTSNRHVWAYPTATPIIGAIIAVPELFYTQNQVETELLAKNVIGGVCSDYVSRYAEFLNRK